MPSQLETGKPRHGGRFTPNLCGQSRPWSLVFNRATGLRILCYHGVCADEAGASPWVRSHFVTASQFRHHVELLLRRGCVAYLPDVIPRMKQFGERAGPHFAITFDDVAACTFVHARPVLHRLGIRASFFVATGHVTTGRLFCGDLVHLLRCEGRRSDCAKDRAMDPVLAKAYSYKQMTLEEADAMNSQAEAILHDRLDPSIREALRPMNWDEVAQLAADGHEIGAHTVDHVILGRQTPQVRREQIANSVLELERRLQTKVTGFAYPNGGPGDFGPPDRTVLHELGVQYALTTRPGSVDGEDVFSLPRISVGLGHTRRRFALELTGVLDRRRRRQYGWR